MLTWQAHAGGVAALAFAGGGRALVSVGRDLVVRGWDPTTCEPRFAARLADLLGRAGSAVPAGQVWVAPGAGGRAAVAAHGWGLAVVDTSTGEPVAPPARARVLGLEPGPAGDGVFVLGPTDYGLRVDRYRVADGAKAETARWAEWWTHPTLPPLAAAPDGRHLAAGSSVHLWPDGYQVRPIRLGTWVPTGYTYSADGRRLFGPVGGKVAVWDAEGGRFVGKLKGHTGRVTGVAVAPDGRHLWTAGRDATARRWDATALAPDAALRLHVGPLECLAVSPDGTLAAAGAANGAVVVWDLG